MLFFFEAGFFVLAIITVAIAEVWGRGQALVLWAAVTTISLLAGPFLRERLARTPPADRTEAQWRSALAESWRHLNKLLLLGLLGLVGWWWLGGIRS